MQFITTVRADGPIKVQLSALIDPELHRRCKVTAATTSHTMSELIETSIRSYLRSMGDSTPAVTDEQMVKIRDRLRVTGFPLILALVIVEQLIRGGISASAANDIINIWDEHRRFDRPSAPESGKAG